MLNSRLLEISRVQSEWQEGNPGHRRWILQTYGSYKLAELRAFKRIVGFSAKKRAFIVAKLCSEGCNTKCLK